MLCHVDSIPVNLDFFCFLQSSPGLSSPPANITTSAVPSIVTPIVNGFTGIPHQPNGHPAVETVYTNGLPPYSTQSPTAADTLQQAFTGVQQYTGVRTGSLCLLPCLLLHRSWLQAKTLNVELVPYRTYFHVICSSSFWAILD